MKKEAHVIMMPAPILNSLLRILNGRTVGECGGVLGLGEIGSEILNCDVEVTTEENGAETKEVIKFKDLLNQPVPQPPQPPLNMPVTGIQPVRPG